MKFYCGLSKGVWPSSSGKKGLNVSQRIHLRPFFPCILGHNPFVRRLATNFILLRALNLRRVILFFCCWSIFHAVDSLADYAWIPKLQHLWLRAGGSYLGSGQNFTADSLRTNLTFGGNPVSFSEVKFFIEPEYTFAPNWAALFRLNFLSNSIYYTSLAAQGLPAGGGIGDMAFSVKWNFVEENPFITLESRVSVPTYSNVVALSNQLVQGDGSVDWAVLVNGGYRVNSFFFALTPGFIFRSGGYATQLLIRTGAGVRFKGGHGMLFSDYYASLTDALLYDSNLNVHDAPGTGGSYARLSGSPSLFTLGIKGSVRMMEHYHAELLLTQSVWGRRAPNFFQVGLQFLAVFDFFKPDTRIKLKEVPLDED